MEDGLYFVKSWEQIKMEYGINANSHIYTKEIEKNIPKGRVIKIDENNRWKGWDISENMLIGPYLQWGEKCLVSTSKEIWHEEIFICYIPGKENSICTITKERFVLSKKNNTKITGFRYWKYIKKIDKIINRGYGKKENKTEKESTFTKKQIDDFQNTLKFWRTAANEGFSKKQDWNGFYKIQKLEGYCAFCEYSKKKERVNCLNCFLCKNNICFEDGKVSDGLLFWKWKYEVNKKERKKYAAIMAEWVEKYFIQENIPFPKRRKK